MRPSLPLVLVVEDSLVVRSVLARQLADCGYSVLEGRTGEQALAICDANPPDVVLLDVNLPGISGYEVLERLKMTPALADIPVIMLTVRQSAEDAVRGLELGAHDYLRKPVVPIELTVRVGGALRLKSARDELRLRNTELEQLSRTDFLTGLPNRRHMDEVLARACAGTRRHGRPVGVLIVDVDHFKQVNDLVGHLAGDAVLKEIARRIAAVLRPEDTAGRWGGDEFLVLLPAAGAAGVTDAGERVRKAVIDQAIAVLPHRELAVAVTIGAAVYRGGDAMQTLRDADEALYRARTTAADRSVSARAALPVP